MSIHRVNALGSLRRETISRIWRPVSKPSPFQRGIGKYGAELRDISGPNIELDAVVGLWTARDWESFALIFNGIMETGPSPSRGLKISPQDCIAPLA